MDVLKKVQKHLRTGKIEYVLVDFFDTLVHRDLGKAERCALAADRICSAYGITDAYAQAVLRIRIESEAFAERAFGRAYTYRQVTDEMLRRMKHANLISQDTDGEGFYHSLLEIEQAVEMAHLYPDARMQRVLRDLLDKGVRVAVVSDYALGKQSLEAYLAHVGIGTSFADIFVSCDCGVTKAEGTLYDHVLQTLQVAPAQCLMIGDDLHSDVQMPQNKGIFAIYMPWREAKERMQAALPSSHEKWPDVQLPTAPRGLDAYAIALYAFCDKLYLSLVRDGHDRVWFLSREGQALKAYFDLYLKAKGLQGIRTEYLYVSRLSTYLPSLAPVQKETFSLFWGKPLSSLLECLHTEKELAAQILAQFPQDHIFNKRDLPRLWANGSFAAAYEKTRMQQRQAFAAYLADEGMSGSDRVAVCDVGWSGTMQDHISAVLGEQTRVQGYYLGLVGRTLRSDPAHSPKHGLLFDAYDLERSVYAYWSFDHTFFERLLCADHGATERYCIKDGKAQPVLCDLEGERDMHAMISPAHQSIEKHFLALCRAFTPGQAQEYEHALARAYLRGIATLTRREMRLQRRLLLCQYENFIIMRQGKEYAGKRLTLANAWAQRHRYLHRSLLSDPASLLTAARVLTNERLYLPARIVRCRAAKMILKWRAK